MQEVTLGAKASRLGIPRLNVGEGSKCRAVMLDPNPRVKYIAFDENLKRRVEVDQELCIKYGLRPITYYFYLVAKLNTDLNGNVTDSQFSVEYLQQTENQYNDFADAVNEQPGFKSLALTKVKKTVEGRDFSYVKVTPSGYSIDDMETLSKKIETIRANKEFIDACWKMIDADSSLTKEQYLDLHKQTDSPKAIEGKNSESPQKAIEAQNDFSSAPNDFGSADSFGEEFTTDSFD